MSWQTKERAPREPWERFPKTRYLGSKRKLLGSLRTIFDRIEFDSALDPFSGTGSVAYLLKTLGKRVTARDLLESSAVCARALVQNQDTRLGPSAAEALLAGLPDAGAPPGTVETIFDGVFFEREENRFIDGLLERIRALRGAHRDLALFALFQACLAKRPYNLFHRANLAMRRRDVKRSFGNKATWDRPFPDLFRRFAAEADRAVFDSGRPCRALRADIREAGRGAFDLVYLDPPYVTAAGQGVDYLDYYHFLEGLASPADWPKKILHAYKHKPIAGRGESPWCDPARIEEPFRSVLEIFSESKLVVSYRSDGIPSIEAIAGWLKRLGKRVEIADAGRYTYALSRNQKSREIILVGV